MRRPTFGAVLLSLTALVAIGIVPVGASAAGAGPDQLPNLGRLTNGGRWMVDARNRVVIPHGLQDYTPVAADVTYFQQHGFTVARVPFHMSEVEPQPGVFDDAFLAALKAKIDMLGDGGIYTLLDAHEDGYGPGLGPDGLPAWMQNTTDPVTGQAAPHTTDVFPVDNFTDLATNDAWRNLWHNEVLPGGVSFTSETGQPISHLQDAYADMWRHVAAYFSGDAHLYAYDLFNEPWPGIEHPYPTCVAVGCPDFDQTQLAPFNKKVIAAIRTVDTQTVTSFEPNVQDATGGQAITLGTNSQNADGNSGINFHPYCLSGLWGTPDLSAGAVLPDPAEDLVCDSKIDQAMAAVDTYQRAACDVPAPGEYCAPALISEFGASIYNAETVHVLARADQYMMPWAFFDKSLAQSTSSTSTQQIISLIDRPYPYAVAGTPVSYGFGDGYRLAGGSVCPLYALAGTFVCPATDRFDLTYSTASVNGKQTTGPTLIYASKAAYPTGYAVVVSGGTVTSAPGATWLTISNKSCAKTVTVAVVPNGTPPPVLPAASGCGALS